LARRFTMLTSVKLALVFAAALGGAAVLCPVCGAGIQTADAQSVGVAAAQTPDTATVRLHISKMTGSCPTTARLALKRLTGVYSATVTLDDSLGVVRYDPRQVNPAQIAAHLTRLTGFGATILPDTTKTSRSPGDD
jgi:copper chaperone CopZ